MTRRRGHGMYQYKHGTLSHSSILYIISEYQLCMFIAIRLRVVRHRPLANIPSARLEIWHPALAGLLRR